jgi:hypothetical protein
MPIQQSNTKQLMDISKNKINKKKREVKLLQEEIKEEEKKHNLFEFMEKGGYTEEDIIKYLGLEVSEEVVETQQEDDNKEDHNPILSFQQDDEDTSEDEYTEVSENEGSINTNICDEIIDLEFSTNGPEATKQIIKRLYEEQDLYIKEKKGHYSVKKNGKELIIENHNNPLNKKYDFGLITTINDTNNLNIVNNWDKFGRNQAKRRKYDFKGKNIESVIEMVHNILS